MKYFTCTLALCAALFLAACGGGGGSSASSGNTGAPGVGTPGITPGIESRANLGFGGGFNAVSATQSGGDVTGVYISNESATANPSGYIEFTELGKVQPRLVYGPHAGASEETVTDGRLYHGTFSTERYVIYVNDDAPVSFVITQGTVAKNPLSVIPEYDFTFMAAGKEVSNIPAGNMDLSFGGLNNVLKNGDVEAGGFTMTVNFSDASVKTLSATTNTSAVTGSDIPITIDDGAFTGDVTLSGQFFGGGSISGKINGNFHGDGATGVTGIYYDTQGPATDYFGAIAGSRQ